MGRFPIPCCCACGASPGVWHSPEWEDAGGLQDWCPDHAPNETIECGLPPIEKTIMNWQTVDNPPQIGPMDQARVLLWRKGWAIWQMGLYSPAHGNPWWFYDAEDDRYWYEDEPTTVRTPTHYMLIEVPTVD